MANNCLVTKLKGSVNADLVKLGECRFPVVNGGLSLQVVGNTPLVIEGKGGVLIDGNATKTISSNGWTAPFPLTGLADDSTIGEISIPNKYTSIIGIECSIADLEDMTPFIGMNLTSFKIYQHTSKSGIRKLPTLSDIVATLPNLIELFYGSEFAKGNLSDLLPLASTLQWLNNTGGASPNIEGDFATLGLFPNLKGISRFCFLSKVTGTVESFVANRLSLTPATAGSVTIKWLGDTNVTYQGAHIDNNATTLAWDAQGNITIS